MEACYEYLGCGKKDCIMQGRKNGPYCWELEGTLCNHYGIEITREELGGKKADACARSACIYFTVAKSRNLL